MFGENLKAMRKEKGYTQEELAIKLNVVRQTISKWEKGVSVPDVEILSKIADVLDTNVSVLLGSGIPVDSDKNAVAEQLAKISEQLAVKNQRCKRMWKIIGFILLATAIFNIFLLIFGTSTDSRISASESSIGIETAVQAFDEKEGATLNLYHLAWA